MGTLRIIWYKLVAKPLWQNYNHLRHVVQDLQNHIGEQAATNVRLSLESREQAKEIVALKRQLAITDPLARSIDVARHHAAQSRIRELERELQKIKYDRQNSYH